MVLTTVTAAQSGPPLRIIRIDHPDRISVEQAMQTEQMIAKPAGAFPGNCHTVIVVDDADRASSALLRCLNRIAENSRMSQGSSQVILAGRPELWDRLADEEFTPLRERIAVRPVLRPMTDEDARGLIKHLLNEPRKIFGQMFANDAEQEVLRLADGMPERVGALVRSTLMLGDLQIRPQLSVEMVRTTADMLDGHLRPTGSAGLVSWAGLGGGHGSGHGGRPYHGSTRRAAGSRAAWRTRRRRSWHRLVDAADGRYSCDTRRGVSARTSRAPECEKPAGLRGGRRPSRFCSCGSAVHAPPDALPAYGTGRFGGACGRKPVTAGRART